MLKTSPDFEKTMKSLQASPLFSNVKLETIEDMLKDFVLITLNKSTELDMDDNMKYFHIILKGRLKMTQIDPNTGKSITLFLLDEGDGFDIFPLLDGREHVVHSRALDDMVLLQAPISRVRDWIEMHPDFNVAFLPYIGNKLRELESFGKSIVFHSTLTRIANLILKFTDHKESDKHGNYVVKLIHNLSHESLAELIGTSRSVLSTQMQKLKNERILVGKKGSILVKDIEKLIEKSEDT